jgi:hypothetical protein
MAAPYCQGDLDGLCGVYAVVNAVDCLCGPLAKADAQRLFKCILQQLEAKTSLAQRCTNGLTLAEMTGILNAVICKSYPIIRYKPFHRQPSIDKAQYLQRLKDFLQQPHSIVLIGLSGYHKHWTLIHRMTDKTLMIHDSGSIKTLAHRHCSMMTDTPLLRHWLRPSHTYFLTRR